MKHFPKHNEHTKRPSKGKERKETSISHWCEKEQRTTVWKHVPDEVPSFDRNSALWPDRQQQNKNQTGQVKEAI